MTPTRAAAVAEGQYKGQYSKAEVKRYNGTKLRELGTSVLKVEASHSSASTRQASAALAQGLQRHVFLARGARVMLTRNLWSEVGLVNGIRGDVVDIVWAHGQKAPALPDSLVLRLEGYTGPVWPSDPRYQGCVPIAPFETSWSTTGGDRGHETSPSTPGPVLVDRNAQEPRADDGQGRRRPGKVGVYSGIDVRVSQPR